MRCHFSSNSILGHLIVIDNERAKVDKVNVLFEYLNIIDNDIRFGIILNHKLNIHFIGPINVFKNHFKFSIMKFQSCDVLFSGTIKFVKNHCDEVISLDSHINILEDTNISFIKNSYQNSLLAVKTTGIKEYNQPYPLCLFQYIAMNGKAITEDFASHYAITFNYNTRSLLHNKSNRCSISFCHFLSHCEWLPSAAFYNYSSTLINQQIIQNDDQNCNYYTHTYAIALKIKQLIVVMTY